MQGTEQANDQKDFRFDGSNGIDVSDIVSILWEKKFNLIIFIAIFIGIAVIYLNLATYKYTATQHITATEQSQSSIPSGLSNLGSFVGVDIGGQGGTPFALFQQALTSEAVAAELARDQNLLIALFPKQWDEETGTWKEPEGAIRSLGKLVKSLLGVPDRPWQPPGAEDIRSHIEKKLIVTTNRSNENFITVQYEHRDPQVAVQLVQALTLHADNFLRSKSLKRAEDYVAYLEKKIAITDVSEYRLLLARALIGYENTRMMASADSNFAAEPFGDTIISNVPTSPNIIFVLLIAIVLAVIAWIFFTLVFSLRQ